VAVDCADEYKRLAGERAAQLVEDGMRVGLGSGTTAIHFVRALGTRVAAGLTVTGVVSSERTRTIAAESGIQLGDLDAPVDFAADGADAIELGTLTAIKGLGGALVREKLIAEHAARFVLIADASKLVTELSVSAPGIPVPVEVLPFGWRLTQRTLAGFGEPRLRMINDTPFISDNGNLVLDLYDAEYADVETLAAALKAIHGVVGHGLFIGMASDAIIAGPSGVQLLTRSA
jgi:ribose 5-phosphate isomerase A